MKTKLLKLLSVFLVSAFIIPGNCFADNKGQKVEHMSDTWLQAKLVTTYALNRNLSLFDIDLDVRDQVAYLDGVVESDIEKNLALEVAKSIEGIKDVKNNIVVDMPKSEKYRQAKSNAGSNRSFGQIVDDLTTTATVKSKLLANSNVSGLDVNVDTENNKVTLKGAVASDIERDLIVNIATNTAGVKEVVNQLKVESKSS